MGEPNVADAEALLSKVLPPQYILVLGAIMPQRLKELGSLSNARLTVVHADQVYVKQLSDAPALQNVEIKTENTAISPDGGKVAFYTNSLERESGFVSADALKPIWKNLEVVSKKDCPSVSLGGFLENQNTTFNWLISDRLDSLSVFEGSPESLQNLDVVVIRSCEGETEGLLKSSAQACEFMSKHGFQLIGRSPERHPALETLLFARDLSLQISQLKDTAERYELGEDTDAVKQKKIAQNNLSALEQRYSELLAKNKRTEKLVADILTRLSRAESALDPDS